MADFKLNTASDGDAIVTTVVDDWDFSTGDLILLEGSDAVAQQLRIRLRMFEGEWFLDTRVGIPYFGAILVKNPNFGAIKAIFRSAIVTTPGIAEADNIVISLNSNRQATVAFQALLDDGTNLDFSVPFVIAA